MTSTTPGSRWRDEVVVASERGFAAAKEVGFRCPVQHDGAIVSDSGSKFDYCVLFCRAIVFIWMAITWTKVASMCCVII